MCETIFLPLFLQLQHSTRTQIQKDAVRSPLCASYQSQSDDVGTVIYNIVRKTDSQETGVYRPRGWEPNNACLHMINTQYVIILKPNELMSKIVIIFFPKNVVFFAKS